MLIRYALWAIILVAGTSAAVAEESCGMHAVRLLAGGQTKELAALFATPSELVEPLQRMADRLGRVTNLQEVPTARFAQHQRISIESKDFRPSNYQGYWINARSEALGALQFHIARAPESACQLLAIQLDTAL
jgi:hypothetical protein